MENHALKKICETPIIQTKRLVLRTFEAGDLDTAYILFNDAEVQKYLSKRNKRNRQQLEVLLEKSLNYWQTRGFGMFCVAEKLSGDMIGYCGFQYFDKTTDIEIVFGYLKEFWGQGFATEAARACLKFGFEKLEFERVLAATVPENTASRFVLEKLHMKCEENSVHYDMNLLSFSISREDFLAVS